jgi:flagellar biosynthesis protein FlhG
MSSEERRRTIAIGIASGKGGVGKTTLSVNLAVALSKLGSKVLLFDGDMGLANAQIALNCTLDCDASPADSEARYFSTLEERIVPTNYGISLLPGTSGTAALANLGREQTVKLIRNFSGLAGHFDYLVVDAAAGISQSVITFLEACDIRIIVGTNEPASITDAYGLFKSLCQANVTDGLYFLPNKCSSREEAKLLTDKMHYVVRHFLGVGIGQVGAISFDSFVNQTWKKCSPMVSCAPQAQVAIEIMRAAETIAGLQVSGKSAGTVRFFED